MIWCSLQLDSFIIRPLKTPAQKSMPLTNEIVIVAGQELQTARLRRERPERDREEHELLRLIADGNDARIRVRNAARLVLHFADIVDDVLLRFVVERARLVDRTDDVHLVVLERQIALVHVDDVIGVVDAETVGVGGEREKENKRSLHFAFIFWGGGVIRMGVMVVSETQF